MPAFAGEYGQLNAIEGGKDLPFDVQRVYYITGVPKGVSKYLPMKTSYHNYLFPDMLSASDNGTELLVLRNTVSSNKYM